jgi:hypothetical protein
MLSLCVISLGGWAIVDFGLSGRFAATNVDSAAAIVTN